MDSLKLGRQKLEKGQLGLLAAGKFWDHRSLVGEATI
jgi:hypothetical protein